MSDDDTLTAKQIELRDRERQILRVATPMIRQGGLAAIQMGKIAKEMRLTRGTLYNHFENREEIVLSLAARAVRRRMEMFRFANSLSLTTRDTIASVGLACEVYRDEMPDDFTVEHMVRHDSVWIKTSAARQQQLQSDERSCMRLVGEVIERAITAGDLKFENNHASPDILLGLWSLTYGGLSIEATSPSLKKAGISDARRAIRRNCNALLDGVHWRPLYDEKQYLALVKSVMPKLRRRARRILVDSEKN